MGAGHAARRSIVAGFSSRQSEVKTMAAAAETQSVIEHDENWMGKIDALAKRFGKPGANGVTAIPFNFEFGSAAAGTAVSAGTDRVVSARPGHVEVAKAATASWEIHQVGSELNTEVTSLLRDRKGRLCWARPKGLPESPMASIAYHWLNVGYS